MRYSNQDYPALAKLRDTLGVINMDWQALKENIYDWDGGWRDIYVDNTTVEDWRKWVDFVNTNYTISWKIFEEESIRDKIDFNTVLKYWAGEREHCSTATVYVGNFSVNAHFFLEKQNENQIVLIDDFKIKSNHITGLNDLYQKFELQISLKDKERILKQLRNSQYFQDSVTDGYSLQSTAGYGLTKKVYRDYEKDNIVCRETYQKLRRGYVSDHDVITISKRDNILTFERINE